jgi:predicted molibdopterin-dependent oxidoreductase YjgC
LLNELGKRETSNVERKTSEVEEMTGVSREALRQAVEILAQAERVLIICGPSFNIQSPIPSLQSLTNSAGPYYLAEDCNSLGALEMGVAPHLLPGRQSIVNGEALKRFGRRWGAKLSSEAGLSADEMLEAAVEGKLKALYVMKSDPATLMGREALEKLDFLVVQDLFLTKTAQLADVVLPAASFAEMEGTFTNLTGRVQRTRAALRPPGEAKPDDQILADLAKALGTEFGYASASEVMAEIAELAPMYGNISYGDLGEVGLPRAEGDREPLASVKPETCDPRLETGDLLALVTGRLLYDGGIRLGQSEIMRQFVPEPFVEINPADAEALGIADRATVTVASIKGELTLVAKVTEDIRPGCVFVPRGFPEAPVGVLLDEAVVVTWVSVVSDQ